MLLQMLLLLQAGCHARVCNWSCQHVLLANLVMQLLGLRGALMSAAGQPLYALR
jgi:hypothetical protein